MNCVNVRCKGSELYLFSFFFGKKNLYTVYTLIDKNPKNAFSTEHVLHFSKIFWKMWLYTCALSVIKRVLIVFYNNALLYHVNDECLSSSEIHVV